MYEAGSASNCLHHIAGRLRVRVPATRRNAGIAAAVERAVRGVAGVRSVNVSLTTGSVLIRYHAAEASIATILDSLQPWLAFERAEAASARTSQIGPIVIKAVTGYLIEAAIERAAIALLAALI